MLRLPIVCAASAPSARRLARSTIRCAGAVVLVVAAGRVTGVAREGQAHQLAVDGRAPREWHVSPTGRADNLGTPASPWDLQTALAGAAGRVGPGDTVWIAGGRYTGTAFTTALRGRADARITFRASRGARATIDGRLLARGAYLDVWGLEITQSAPASYDSEMQLLDIRTDHGRFINLVLHDANTHGANVWTPGVNAELYGSIIYNNGTHENLDHGIYVHNAEGTKRITDNIFFNNFARGIQVYASRRNAHLRNVHVEGNIAFNNGVHAARSTRVNLLFNGQVPVSGMAAVDNVLYYSPGVGGINLRAGHFPQAYTGLVVRGNHVAGGATGLDIGQPWDDIVIEENTVTPSTGGVAVRVPMTAAASDSYRWRNNRFVAPPDARAWQTGGTREGIAAWRARTRLGTDDVIVPTAARPVVVVRPNRYEPGRAHVAILNPGGAPRVAVSLAGVLRPGDRYVIHNVQRLWDDPVAEGTFTGTSVMLPMTGVEPPAPAGRITPHRAPRTGPHFDAFLVTRVAR